MKKFIAVICMAAMLVGTAFAAKSPTWDPAVKVTGGDVAIAEPVDKNAGDSLGKSGAVVVQVNAAEGKEDGANKGQFSTTLVTDGNLDVYSYADGKWSKIGTAAVTGGKFEFEFTTPATVAFVPAEAAVPADSSKAADNSSKAADNSASTAGKSDKTGEPAVMAIVALIATLSVAGMVVSAKKEN